MKWENPKNTSKFTVGLAYVHVVLPGMSWTKVFVYAYLNIIRVKLLRSRVSEVFPNRWETESMR